MEPENMIRYVSDLLVETRRQFEAQRLQQRLKDELAKQERLAREAAAADEKSRAAAASRAEQLKHKEFRRMRLL